MSTKHYEAVADTSFLRALLLEDEPGHEEAQRIANCVERFIVPSIVLHELVWSTRRSHGPALAQSLAAYVLGDEKFSYEPIGVGDVLFALRDPRRYEDLLVLSAALRLRKPLASFDKGLVKLARRHGVQPAVCQ
jgi:predicted nucleic acid-binding protein